MDVTWLLETVLQSLDRARKLLRKPTEQVVLVRFGVAFQPKCSVQVVFPLLQNSF